MKSLPEALLQSKQFQLLYTRSTEISQFHEISFFGKGPIKFDNAEKCETKWVVIQSAAKETDEKDL